MLLIDIIKKIDILNDLAWALGDIDLKRAQTLSETAYTLAASSDDAAPYLAGMAYSLRTQGYLNQRFGNYPLGLTQLLRAQEMCESLQLNDGLTDVLDGIAGIYFETLPSYTEIHREHAEVRRAFLNFFFLCETLWPE